MKRNNFFVFIAVSNNTINDIEWNSKNQKLCMLRNCSFLLSLSNAFVQWALSNVSRPRDINDKQLYSCLCQPQHSPLTQTDATTNAELEICNKLSGCIRYPTCIRIILFFLTNAT